MCGGSEAGENRTFSATERHCVWVVQRVEETMTSEAEVQRGSQFPK